MFYQREYAGSHETGRAYRGSAARHLRHLDDASPYRDLDAAPGAGSDDVVPQRRPVSARVDHDLDPVALHTDNDTVRTRKMALCQRRSFAYTVCLDANPYDG